MTDLEKSGSRAKEAARELSMVSTQQKNAALAAMADLLEKEQEQWLSANRKDIENARQSGMSKAMLDRLTLTPERIRQIADGLRYVAELPDPVGKTVTETVRPNGLRIRKVRVPLGVVAIIFEARPNVAADSAALCLKSGNACILRGGKETIFSNSCAVDLMRRALHSCGLPEDAICLVRDTGRESARELMRLDRYVDVLIPRGGAGLIRAAVKEARVPVIRTGEGVCHIYVDRDANLEMGAKILYNAKCSRPSVCNAAECLLLHKDIAKDFLRAAVPLLDRDQVEIRGDETVLELLGSRAKAAEPEDWDAEYNDYILAVKTVESLQEAVDFIAAHGTGHSESIITENPETADAFLKSVDAAAVYVNASTRFTDGGEFGLGAEIGISTQKLHARGPMGLEELTGIKYLIYGSGQIR